MAAARENPTAKKVVKKPAPSTAFGPVGGAPLAAQQRQAAAATKTALRKVEAKTVVPYVPKLADPTAQQRAAVGPQVARALHAQGITTPQQVAALPAEQRTRVNRARGYTKTAALGRAPGPKASAPTGVLGQAYLDAHTPHFGGILDGFTTDPYKAIGKAAKSIPGIPGRALQDAVDLPANTVTSLYGVGKTAAEGHLGKAAKMLADPVVYAVKHPIESFTQHPLNTVLILRGVKGSVGHSAGKVMRTGALGKAAKGAASTERAARALPNAAMERVQRRQYSRDPSAKAVQVLVDKGHVRLSRVATGRRLGVQSPTVMRAKDIKRAVNEDVQAAKVISGNDVAASTNQAHDALIVKRGRGKVKPTAATSLAAQGITTASKADLAKYLAEIRAQVPNLTGDHLALNHDTQALIRRALANHDPAAVQKAAAAYSKLSANLEAQVVAHKLVDPAVAETTRLQGVKVRRVKRKGPTLAAKEQTGRAVKDARTEAGGAEAQYTQALTDAREAARTNKGRVPPAQHDALLRAIDRRDKAQAVLTQTRVASRAAKTAHTRAYLPAGSPEPAFVSHQPLPARTAALPTSVPRVRVSTARTGEAIRQGTLDAHPAKLVEQIQSTQRLISASKARNHFIEHYGYRDQPGGVKPFASAKAAKNFARQSDVKARTGQPWTSMKMEDGSHALVPKVAHDQLRAFEGQVNAQHPVMRGIGTQWRRNVLAFSPRWLASNSIEAAVRSVAALAGPTSQVAARRVLRKADPQTRADVLARTASSGNYSAALRLVDDRKVGTGKDLGRFAQTVAALRKAPGAKQLADAYESYTQLVFRSLNGRLESQFRVGMLGKALLQHPLMEGHVIKLSRQAVAEAARGLKDTNVQAELGRAVDDMYGKYDKFSPELQGAIANYTPFIAWTLNATNFLYHVLPRDHPVLTGLLASANTATEGWRKQHGLYLDFLGKTPSQVPGWLQGSLPGAGGSHLRLARYTPFGLMDTEGAGPLGGLESLLLPQLSEILANFGGKDWQGKRLSSNPSAARALTAGVTSFFEGQIPLAAQAAHVAGLRLPNMPDTAKITVGAGTRAREQFDPFRYTPAKKPVGSGRVATKAGAVSWGNGTSSGVQWSDQTAGGGVSWGG